MFSKMKLAFNHFCKNIIIICFLSALLYFIFIFMMVIEFSSDYIIRPYIVILYLLTINLAIGAIIHSLHFSNDKDYNILDSLLYGIKEILLIIGTNIILFFSFIVISNILVFLNMSIISQVINHIDNFLPIVLINMILVLLIIYYYIKYSFVYFEVLLNNKNTFEALESSYKLVKINEINLSMFLAFLISSGVSFLLSMFLLYYTMFIPEWAKGFTVSYGIIYFFYMLYSFYLVALIYTYYEDLQIYFENDKLNNSY